MDLGAYVQIESLDIVIFTPRLNHRQKERDKE
jgi:hypothetical protein